MSQILAVFLAAAAILLYAAHYLFWGFKPIGRAETIKDYLAHGLLMALITGCIISFTDLHLTKFLQITTAMPILGVYFLVLIDTLFAQVGPRKEMK